MKKGREEYMKKKTIKEMIRGKEYRKEVAMDVRITETIM